MKKNLLLLSALLMSSVLTAWADSETTYAPQQDVCFRTGAGNTGWNNGYPKDAAVEGNTGFEGNFNAGIFVLQKYTVADLNNATSLVLTLTDTGTTGVDGTMVWLYPDNNWSAESSIDDMLAIVTDVVGVAPRSTEGTVNSPLATGQKVPDSDPKQGYFSITGNALAQVKAAAQNGTFTLMITDKSLISNSSRKFYSSNSENAETVRPFLVAKVETPVVLNETTGVGYSSLNDAVSAVSGEATLVLNKEVVLTARVNIPADAVVSIVPAEDGITIKRGENNKSNILFLPGSGCTLNIGTADKQLVIDGQGVEATNVAVEASNGTVTLTNVLFKNHTTSSTQGVVSRKSNSVALTLDGCTFENCNVAEGRGVVFFGKNGSTLKGNNSIPTIYIEQNYQINGAEATHTTPIEVIVQTDKREAGILVKGGKLDQYTVTGLAEGLALAETDNGLEVVEGSTNGISAISTVQTDGQPVFDMQGRRVEKAQKGLYIMGGKKIVVK